MSQDELGIFQLFARSDFHVGFIDFQIPSRPNPSTPLLTRWNSGKGSVAY